MNTLDTWLSKIETLKTELDAYRPLPPEALEQLRRFYRIGFTYSSNALEGNTLTESETKIVLEEGITVAGKSLAEHLEAVGHGEALDKMLLQVQAGILPGEATIQQWHEWLMFRLLGPDVGQYRKTEVLITGSSFVPPHAAQLTELMAHFCEVQLPAWVNNTPSVVAAALAHHQLVNIHPFLDGNGRLSRLLMNHVLLLSGYPLLIIPPVLRNEYIASLRANDALKVSLDSSTAFITFIAEMAYESMKDYLRLVRHLVG